MIQRLAARLVVVVCIVGLVACGVSARTKALRVNLVALNTARDATLAISREREQQIYDSCNLPSCTKEEGHARVDAWREVVDGVIKALDVGYRAIHDAALLDDAESSAAAAAAAAKALDLYKALKENR